MTSRHLLAVLLISGVANLDLAQQPTWHHRSRWQLALEQDGNIRESPWHAESATSLRLLTDLRAQRLGSKGLAEISFQGACQAYLAHSEENKLMGDLSASVLWRASARWALGAQATARGKLLLREQPDYLFSSLVFFADTRLPGRVGLRTSCARESLDYANSTIYDHGAWRGELALSRPLSARITLVLAAGLEKNRIDRPAFRFHAATAQWCTFPYRHEDRLTHCGVSLELRLLGQWRLSYRYEDNASNSYGYSYSRHRLQLLAGARLSRTLLLRLFGALQRKRYTEALGPWIPLGLDTEREQSNLLVADLSHDFAPGYTVLLRLAWYDNESLVRGRYYRKGLVCASLERRF